MFVAHFRVIQRLEGWVARGQLCRLLLSAMVIMAIGFSAQAVTFTYSFIPYPNLGVSPIGGGINDSGQIVVGGGGSFLRQPDGTVSPITSNGYTSLYAINNPGQMVGVDDSGGSHGVFRDSNGSYSRILLSPERPGCGTPFGGFGFGINNLVQIVGFDTCGSGFIAAGLSESYKTFDCPNSPVQTRVEGINDLGQAVGFCFYGTNGQPQYAFSRDVNGNITSLSQPGWISSEARGINNAGQIVGNFSDGSGQHGFFRDKDGSVSVLQGTALGINGSAREFGETANWRRLERFALPGMAGIRIPARSGRSGAATC